MTKSIEAKFAQSSAEEQNHPLAETAAEMIERHESESNEKVTSMIELLDTDKKLTVKDLASKMNEIIEFVNSRQINSGSSGDTVRDIKSDRSMIDEDARSVLLGDLKDASTKEAALELGLSYGQIYSCRKGFTFKKVYKEFRELAAQDTDSE
jgi:hypothetical protein